MIANTKGNKNTPPLHPLPQGEGRHKDITKYPPPLIGGDARNNIPPPLTGGGKGEGERTLLNEKNF